MTQRYGNGMGWDDFEPNWNALWGSLSPGQQAQLQQQIADPAMSSWLRNTAMGSNTGKMSRGMPSWMFDQQDNGQFTDGPPIDPSLSNDVAGLFGGPQSGVDFVTMDEYRARYGDQAPGSTMQHPLYGQVVPITKTNMPDLDLEGGKGLFDTGLGMILGGLGMPWLQSMGVIGGGAGAMGGDFFGPPADLAGGMDFFGPPSDLAGAGDFFGPPSDLAPYNNFDTAFQGPMQDGPMDALKSALQGQVDSGAITQAQMDQALAGGAGGAGGGGSGGGMLDGLGGLLNPKNIGAIGSIIGGLTGKAPQTVSGASGQPAYMTQGLPPITMQSSAASPYAGNPLTYGMTGGEHMFFNNSRFAPQQTPGYGVQYKNMADGGTASPPDYMKLRGSKWSFPEWVRSFWGGDALTKYNEQLRAYEAEARRRAMSDDAAMVEREMEDRPGYFRKGYAGGGLSALVQGAGTGQSDRIPAMLSDGEYVMDADTVSALGDGSNRAGAEKLDGMRQEIRKHKRRAPLNKIPAKAKEPTKYLKKSRGA